VVKGIFKSTHRFITYCKELKTKSIPPLLSFITLLPHPTTATQGVPPLMRLHEAQSINQLRSYIMNLFTFIGTILASLAAMITELCAAGETTARTINKTVGIAETSVDEIVAENQAKVEALQKPVRQPRAKAA
jgi:hypothetical protein